MLIIKKEFDLFNVYRRDDRNKGFRKDVLVKQFERFEHASNFVAEGVEKFTQAFPGIYIKEDGDGSVR